MDLENDKIKMQDFEYHNSISVTSDGIDEFDSMYIFVSAKVETVYL